jgi:hypothetical protein
MSRDVLIDDYRFTGARIVPATAVDGPWSKVVDTTGGTPTLLNSAGACVGTIVAGGGGLEIVTLYTGDALGYDIDDLISAEFWISLSGMDSVSRLVCGMASAYNATADSVAANAWFRVEGSASTSALLVETDDGTTDTDDKATGLTLGSTVRKLQIKFADDVYSASPPASSLGGKANVKFLAENSQGLLIPVATTTRFDMSAYSSRLQPYVHIRRDSGSGTPAFSLKRVRITYREPN